MRRSRDLPAAGNKEKWKLRVRILSASHSIRPKALTKWNKQIDWIKLVYTKKNELIFEIILKDNVPVEGLWFFGWGMARHFVVALNIAEGERPLSMGGDPHGEHDVLVINGRDFAKDILGTTETEKKKD